MVDFRPVVGQIMDLDLTVTVDMTNIPDLSTNDTANTGLEYAPLSYINGRSFLTSRNSETNNGTNFDTNPSNTGTPVNGSNVQGDITFYVPRIDKLFLHKSSKVPSSTRCLRTYTNSTCRIRRWYGVI